MSAENFACSLANAKKSFYRAFNAVFRKVAGAALEEMTVELAQHVRLIHVDKTQQSHNSSCRCRCKRLNVCRCCSTVVPHRQKKQYRSLDFALNGSAEVVCRCLFVFLYKNVLQNVGINFVSIDRFPNVFIKICILMNHRQQY